MIITKSNWTASVLLFILFATPQLVNAGDREVININDNWKFKRKEVSAGDAVGFSDSSWESVNLPHTWNNLDGQDGFKEGTERRHGYYRGTGWYRKTLVIPESSTGKRVFLNFESINNVSRVYVDGQYVGQHIGGCAAFNFDITDYVIPGEEHLIAVRVHNIDVQDAPLKGDWTKMGGITRDVNLVITNETHITMSDYGSPGVFLTQTNVSEKSADLEVLVKLRNDANTEKDVTIQTRIVDADGKLVKLLEHDLKLLAKTNGNAVQQTVIQNPRLWNGRKDPYLYKALVSVKVNGEEVDYSEQPLGFRYYWVDKDKGFFLNGEHYDLHGVAIHESRQDKGMAISNADRAEDIDIVMDMGATWVRLSHYQHGKKMYELADEKGLVLWTEVPYMRTVNIPSYAENLTQQYKALVRQNYNHPSVCFWGLFNEITEDHNPQNANPYAYQLVREMNQLVKSEDPTRLTACASFPRAGADIPYKWYADVTGFNIYFGWYELTAADIGPYLDKVHAQFPDKKFSISEYGAGASIYAHEEIVSRPDPKSIWHPEENQSLFHEVYWKALSERPYMWSKTIWNGFDFSSDGREEGDQYGINDKGLVTFDRKVKKDAFYWYKANWSEEPFAYITSRRFVDRDEVVKQLKVYSNCDSVELFINGISQKMIQSPDRKFVWKDRALKRGRNTIKAVGHKSGKKYTDQCEWISRPIAERVKASSAKPGSTHLMAVDHNLETAWEATGFPQWLEIELLDVQSIKAVELVPKDARIYQYKIEVSEDGKAYTKILDKSDNTEIKSTKWPQAHPYIKSLVSGEGKFVRLTITGCHEADDEYTGIEEFKVVRVPLDSGK